MLGYSLLFLIVAIVAGALGFWGISGVAASVAKVLFVVFLVLFIVSLLSGRRRPPVRLSKTVVFTVVYRLRWGAPRANLGRSPHTAAGAKAIY
jgi:uncharacterized membrane protein YtjA (UPF0391 family)